MAFTMFPKLRKMSMKYHIGLFLGAILDVTIEGKEITRDEEDLRIFRVTSIALGTGKPMRTDELLWEGDMEKVTLIE